MPLSVLTLVMVGAMMLVPPSTHRQLRQVLPASSSKTLGKVNGYIEEMMNGQKVVKVFCHEEDAIKEFNEAQR